MTAQAARQDGRRQRAARNQNAVVEAMLDLYRAGELRPSAQAIAARAGVSTRTVFRLVDDLEALDQLALQRQWARVGHLFAPPEAVGDRARRIAALVAQRLALYAAIAPVARVARLRAPFSEAIRHGIAWRDHTLREQVQQQFAAELAPLPLAERADLLCALDLATSIEALELLHAEQGRPLAEVERIVSRTLRALLAATDSDRPPSLRLGDGEAR